MKKVNNIILHEDISTSKTFDVNKAF